MIISLKSLKKKKINIFKRIKYFEFKSIDSKKNKGAIKAVKGSHASNNAYMLVYTRRDSESGRRQPENFQVPHWVEAALLSENEFFETWIQDVQIRKVNFHINIIIIFWFLLNLL